MANSLPRMPLNHPAKFDAASFVFAGEIRNCTNKQKQTNKNTRSGNVAVAKTASAVIMVYDADLTRPN